MAPAASPRQMCLWAQTLSCSSSNTLGASGAAASAGLCTAGSTSYSTLMSFLAFSSVSRSSAAISAMASPR